MAQKPLNERTLLYDPLFETPPDTVIRDTPGRGFWGKAAVKKTVFILLLSLFVGGTIALSFSSLTKDVYKYEKTEDGGWMLSEYNAAKTDTVLQLYGVTDETGAADAGKPVTAVRKFAVCCNESTNVILVGKNVHALPAGAFYSCTALQAVLVEEGNPLYCDIEGVLYRKENSAPAELLLYPAENYLYRALLALGEPKPAAQAEAEAFAARANALKEKSGEWLQAQKENYPAAGFYSLTNAERSALSAALTCEIAPGTKTVGELAFAECKTLFRLQIPEGVTEIGPMAFYKCGELRGIELPESLETLGSDAFSYCAKAPEIFIPSGVKSIGHHAFYGCAAAREVRLACAESEKPLLGQDWLPKERRLFEHDVPVTYNAGRRAP